jgi:hypothetical protein
MWDVRFLQGCCWRFEFLCTWRYVNGKLPTFRKIVVTIDRPLLHARIPHGTRIRDPSDIRACPQRSGEIWGVSRPWLWTAQCCGLWRRVAFTKYTDISDVPASCVIRVKELWRRQQNFLKCRYISTRLNGVVCLNTAVFMFPTITKITHSLMYLHLPPV